jgi:hypothetical protein
MIISIAACSPAIQKRSNFARIKFKKMAKTRKSCSRICKMMGAILKGSI